MLNKRWALSILGVVVLLFIPLLGCLEDTDSGKSSAPIVTATDQQQNSRLTTVETKNTEQDTKLSELAGKIAAIPPQTGASQASLDTANSKISDLQTKINDLQSKYSALETKVSQWTNPVTGQTPTPPAGTPAGVVSYTIQNPLQFYQFQSGGANFVVIKIFNNTPQSQKVRPQITINTYGGTTAGTVSANTCTITSNSQGQANVTFTGNAFPAGAVTSVVFYASGGGFNQAGEYLLGSGTGMDIYAQISITSTTSALWTIQVTGSNLPL